MKFISKQAEEKQRILIEEYKQKLADLIAENQKLTVGCDGLRQLSAQAASEHEKKLSGLEQRLTQLSDQIKALTQERDDALKQVSSIENQRVKLANDLGELQKSLEQHKIETQKSIQSEQQLAQSKDAEVKKITQKFNELQEENKTLKNAQSEASRKIETLTSDHGAVNKELTELQANHAKQIQLTDQYSKDLKLVKQELALKQGEVQAAHGDLTQENELLLLQLMQAQEELVEYYDEKVRFEKLFDAYKARWERLEKRYPQYADFGGLEFISYDHISEFPSITWRVRDYAQGGLALPEFMFQVVLQDGHPGIALVNDEGASAFEDSALVPKLMTTRAAQIDKFMALGATEFRQLSAALGILAQLEATKWVGVNIPDQFDIAFWAPSIKLLAAQWKDLPVTLRYDQVKLKRELINPDYEHLWLELHGAVYGQRQWKKLELRLGAALVQSNEFSKYPKYELPLIDGKHKPFDSWFAESHDDSGPKFELRFSLEKNVFDIASLSQLTEHDRGLVLRLVYVMPAALTKLQREGVSIHRPWDTWIDFSKAALKVLESNRKLLNEQKKVSAINSEKALDQEASSSASDSLLGKKPDLANSPLETSGKVPSVKVIRVGLESSLKRTTNQKESGIKKSAGTKKSITAVAKATPKNTSKPVSVTKTPKSKSAKSSTPSYKK